MTTTGKHINPTPTKQDEVTAALVNIVVSPISAGILALTVRSFAARAHRVLGTPALPAMSKKDGFLLALTARYIINVAKPQSVVTKEKMAADRVAREQKRSLS